MQCAQASGKTAGGVLLTNEGEKPTFGTVVAVGGGKKGEDGNTTKPNVAVGSTVMYSKYAGTEFEVRWGDTGSYQGSGNSMVPVCVKLGTGR
jgi:chaperonin GroES